MGWWHVTTLEGKQLLMSDEGADTLGFAFDKVSEIFQKTYKRKPTRAEMQYAVDFVLRVFLTDNLDED